MSGPVDNTKSGLTQTYSNGTYTVGISNSYLQSLPASSFPAVIDPTVAPAEYFGNRSGGNYESFESTGYNCPSTICDLYAGAVVAQDGSLQDWRGAFYAELSNHSQLGGDSL